MTDDLPWTSIQQVSGDAQLSKVVHAKGPTLIYLYSPKCYYSQFGAPVFESAVKNLKDKGFKILAYRYNAVPSSDMNVIRQAHKRFQDIVLGAPIKHYPMLVGISRDGRVVEYNGTINPETLRTFYMALEKT